MIHEKKELYHKMYLSIYEIIGAMSAMRLIIRTDEYEKECEQLISDNIKKINILNKKIELLK